MGTHQGQAGINPPNAELNGEVRWGTDHPNDVLSACNKAILELEADLDRGRPLHNLLLDRNLKPKDMHLLQGGPISVIDRFDQLVTQIKGTIDTPGFEAHGRFRDSLLIAISLLSEKIIKLEDAARAQVDRQISFWEPLGDALGKLLKPVGVTPVQIANFVNLSCQLIRISPLVTYDFGLKPEQNQSSLMARYRGVSILNKLKGELKSVTDGLIPKNRPPGSPE